MEKRSPEEEQSGCKNSNKIKFLEVIYVADTCAIQLYGLIDLPEMLLSISNIVRMLTYINIDSVNRNEKSIKKINYTFSS